MKPVVQQRKEPQKHDVLQKHDFGPLQSFRGLL
jgi:hypothetical protein